MSILSKKKNNELCKKYQGIRKMTRTRIEILNDMEKLDKNWNLSIQNREKLNQLGKELEQYYIEAFEK
jgi:hypothetical protein